MFEQQNIDAGDGVVNPARELSASLFSEQISHFQKCDGHVPRPPENDSEQAINQQLNENIYNSESPAKDVVGSSSESPAKDVVSSGNEPESQELSTGNRTVLQLNDKSSESDTQESTEQESFSGNGTELKLRGNIHNLVPKESNYSPEIDPRVSILSDNKVDKGIEIDSAVEVSPGRLSNEADSPKTEEQQVAEAVDWAKKNFNRFDLHKDGLLQKWELDLPQITKDASEHDLEMLRVLSDNKDKIKFAHIDDFDGRKGEGKDGITMKDLNVLDKHFEKRSVFHEAEIESRDLAETLLKGDKPLFDFLDRASNGQNDGIIGKGDLQRYMTDYEYLKQYGVNTGPYSQENVEAVSRLLETWDLNTYPGPGTRMRGFVNNDSIKHALSHPRNLRKYNHITREKVVRAVGLG